MSTTYRFTIWTNSVREMRVGSASAARTWHVPRDSKGARAHAFAEFEAALAENVPDGREARAWLEVSRNGYTSTLAKFTGRATQRAPISAYNYGAAIGGQWLEHDVKGTLIKSIPSGTERAKV